MAEVPPKFAGLWEDADALFVPFIPGDFGVASLPLNGRFGNAGRRSSALPSEVFLEAGLAVKGLLEIPGRVSTRATEGRLAEATFGFFLSCDKMGLNGFRRVFAAAVSPGLMRFFKYGLRRGARGASSVDR